MLAALERSLERERRFVNEASHELRTPLTLLKSRIQLAQRRSRTRAEHEVVLDELAVDVTRLTELAPTSSLLSAPSGAHRRARSTSQISPPPLSVDTALRTRNADQLSLEGRVGRPRGGHRPTCARTHPHQPDRQRHRARRAADPRTRPLGAG